MSGSIDGQRVHLALLLRPAGIPPYVQTYDARLIGTTRLHGVFQFYDYPGDTFTADFVKSRQ